MFKVILENCLNFRKILTLILLASLVACVQGPAVSPSAGQNPGSSSPSGQEVRQDFRQKLLQLKTATLLLGSNKEVKVYLAIKEEEQVQGLSGLRDGDFLANEGMLFFYNEKGPRRFWMPDIYFDLDLFFMDENHVITDVVRGLKSHPGRQVPPDIAMTPTIMAQSVLELKSSAPEAQLLNVGSKLNWKNFPQPNEIESYIRQGQ